ncbi:hypothetical protein FOA43_002609 [Brettanomyces nanus]|uniref:Mediator of RNA polymerase II transcription subunit 12 n=1 Tax=Eeniella nana TaxID=13502 RepID=A0A875S698_EENNA|nr:uncharacterized protein FOA43_002609 [Brettanomyces nanus]QPG75259.1 hypothetical protein FOA43_002609 [Brettanomyces nanus]
MANTRLSTTAINDAANRTSSSFVYPDFRIWKHTACDDTRMRNHLQKGYFETPIVTNECHSGRQVIIQLLHKADNITKSIDRSSLNNSVLAEKIVHAKMSTLSDAMIRTLRERRNINKIRGKSTYKPPPRVTLTEHKRDMWLKNLANSAIPLRQLSKAIPHGLRNKSLFEQCFNHNIPIARAIWLIKCVSSNEQRQLKRKAGKGNFFGAITLTNRWIVEWTDQVCSYLEQIYLSCFTPKFKDSWNQRFDYALRLSTNLYLQELLNQETFLAWMVNYMGRITSKKELSIQDFRTLSLHYHIIRLFWFKLLKIDYLAKELGENMLLIVAKLYELPRNDKYDELVIKMSSQFQYLIKYLFYYNSDNFIIPNNWYYLRSHLKRLLDMNIGCVTEQFKLITYRNESLMIDETDRKRNQSSNSYCYNKASQIVYKLDNYGSSELNLRDLCQSIFTDTSGDWKGLLSMALHWAITIDREIYTDYQRISLTCSILQIRLYEASQLKPKRFKQAKLELEVEITEFVYEMANTLNYSTSTELPACSYSLANFLVLVNRLFQMDLFVVSSYLRRLIASGVIYLSEPDKSCYIHLLILHSLPAFKDSNVSNILKRLSDTTNIKVPSEQERETVAKTQKKLLEFSNTLFSIDRTASSNVDLYDLMDGWCDSEEYPMQIGRKLELGSWFMKQINTALTNGRMKLISSDLIVLYHLMKDHFHRFPRFIHLIFEQLDKGKVDILDNDSFKLLLKMAVHNTKLLNSYLIDVDTTIWKDLNRIVDNWKITDRFHIEGLLQSCRFQPLHGTATSFQTSLSLDTLSILGISSRERLSNAAEYSHHLNQNMSQYFNVVKGFNFQLRGPILELMNDLKRWKPADFDNLLIMYLKKFIQPTLSLDYSADLKLILKLIVDDLIDLSQVLSVFVDATQNKLDEFSSDSSKRLHWDLLFGQDLDLDDHEYFLTCFYRRKYRESHTKDYYEILLTFLQSETPNSLTHSASAGQDVEMGAVDDIVPVDVMNSLHELANVSVVTPLESPRRNNNSMAKERKYSPDIVDSIWCLVALHMDIFIELFYKGGRELDGGEICRFFFQGVLKLRYGSDEDTLSYVDELIKNLNYYNLHVCQWLFKDLIENEFDKVENDEYELNCKIAKVILNILSRVKESKPLKDIYLIGELFEFVSDKYKLRILSNCEDLFLGSDSFPKFAIAGAEGESNMTQYLTNIISSCSRLKDYEAMVIPMSDALVFSLNLSLEKLIYYCHGLEHKKKISADDRRCVAGAVKLISKIVLIHKNFLVELILKRSVNLQRDVLLMNLLKLFKTRLMDRDLRLKNLLHDILISIKVLISESVSLQYQKQQQQQQPQQQQQQKQKKTSVGNMTSPISKPTPSSSFLSPSGESQSPLSPQSDNKTKTPASNIPAWRTAMAIDPPSVNNRLKFLLSKFYLRDALETPDSNYYLVDEQSGQMAKYHFRRFDMIEDASPYESLNNSCLSLQLFDCSIERKNPK